MKHGKRLTRDMKKFLTGIGLDPSNWLYIKNTPDEIHFINIKSNKISKYTKEEINHG